MGYKTFRVSNTYFWFPWSNFKNINLFAFQIFGDGNVENIHNLGITQLLLFYSPNFKRQAQII